MGKVTPPEASGEREVVEALEAMAKAGSEDEEPSYPESWIFSEHGETVAGTFVKFDRGPTKGFGQKTLVVLDVAGTERTVWLLWDALFNRFRDEVAERAEQTLVVGERVIIKRLPEKKRSKNDREYIGFEVFFPDRPAPTQEQLWGDLSDSTRPSEQVEAAVESTVEPGDGDIPS
jgi:hypothetical protein